MFWVAITPDSSNEFHLLSPLVSLDLENPVLQLMCVAGMSGKGSPRGHSIELSSPSLSRALLDFKDPVQKLIQGYDTTFNAATLNPSD